MTRYHFRIAGCDTPHGQPIDSTTKAASEKAVRDIVLILYGNRAAERVEVWVADETVPGLLREQAL